MVGVVVECCRPYCWSCRASANMAKTCSGMNMTPQPHTTARASSTATVEAESGKAPEGICKEVVIKVRRSTTEAPSPTPSRMSHRGSSQKSKRWNNRSDNNRSQVKCKNNNNNNRSVNSNNKSKKKRSNYKSNSNNKNSSNLRSNGWTMAQELPPLRSSSLKKSREEEKRRRNLRRRKSPPNEVQRGGGTWTKTSLNPFLLSRQRLRTMPQIQGPSSPSPTRAPLTPIQFHTSPLFPNPLLNEHFLKTCEYQIH